jgi:hypothetical protein
MVQILVRLQAIELEVLSNSAGPKNEHVGSIRFLDNKYHGEDVQKRKFILADMFMPTKDSERKDTASVRTDDSESEGQIDTDEDEVMRTASEGSMQEIHVGEREVTTWRTARWDEAEESRSRRFANADGKLLRVDMMLITDGQPPQTPNSQRTRTPTTALPTPPAQWHLHHRP